MKGVCDAFPGHSRRRAATALTRRVGPVQRLVHVNRLRSGASLLVIEPLEGVRREHESRNRDATFRFLTGATGSRRAVLQGGDHFRQLARNVEMVIRDHGERGDGLAICCNAFDASAEHLRASHDVARHGQDHKDVSEGASENERVHSLSRQPPLRNSRCVRLLS